MVRMPARLATLALTIAALIAVNLAEGTPAYAAGVGWIEVTAMCSLTDAINAANAGGSLTGDCRNHLPGTTTIRITANSGTALVPGTTNESDIGVQLDPNNPGTASVDTNATMTQPIKANVTIEGDPALARVAIYALPLAPRKRVCTVETDPPYDEVCRTETAARGGRFFEVAPGGSLTLRNLTLAGGAIEGRWETVSTDCPTFVNCGYHFATNANGGAILAYGPLTLDHVTLAENRATGGSSATGYPWRGSSASGGAIYSTSTVTVRNSVFDANRVQATHSGSALGAAIALAPSGRATISDSLFMANAADGGDGPAGANGRDGKAGAAGADGTCSDADWSLANGALGGAGNAGVDGEDGGDGGDAVGVISGGASVAMDHSSMVDSYARAGAAGIGGFGGNGGAGGDGGDGAVCTNIIDTVPGPALAWNGIPGMGGAGGNNGTNGLSGDRGTAVTTVDTDGTLTLTDVTIDGGPAIVPDDDMGGQSANDYVLARLDSFRVAKGGRGGFIDVGTGVHAPNGPDGKADTTFLDREKTITSGAAVALEPHSADKLSISFSTIADLGTLVPSGTNHRQHATAAALTFGTGIVAAEHGPAVGLSSSILWNPDLGAEQCPNLGHEGFTNVVRAASTCQGTLAPIDSSDVRPMSATRSYFGDALRPGFHAVDRAYQLPLLTTTAASRAVDRRAATDCTTLAGVTLLDDERRSPRDDLHCDAGAFELDKSATSPTVTTEGPAYLYRGAAPTPVTVTVPANQGASTLTITVIGIDGVNFPAGFTSTPADDDPGKSSASIAIGAGQTYPYAATFGLVTNAAAGGQVTVAAELTTPAGSTEAPNLVLPVRDNGEIFVAIDAPDQWSPCQGYLPITYTASSVGDSPAPGATITVTPNIVRRTEFNGLTLPPGRPEGATPLVYPSAGTTVAVGDDGSVRWTIPALGRGDAEPTLTTYLAIGRLDQTQPMYLPGASIQAGYAVTYAGGTPPDTPVRPLPTTSIQLTNDLGLIRGVLGEEVGTASEIHVKAGTSRPAWVSLDSAPCAVPTTKEYRWAPLTMTVRNPEGGTPDTPVVGPIATFLRLDGTPGDQWLPIGVGATTAPGRHYFDLEVGGPGATPVVTQIPYVVDPIQLSLGDAPALPEASPDRTFDITLDAPLTQDLTMAWHTREGGTATPDADYLAASGLLTIPAGQTSRTFHVAVLDDQVAEANESIWVEMTVPEGGSLPAGVKITRWAAQTAILDDDDAGLSVDDVSVTEGTFVPTKPPTTAATFRVRIPKPSDQPTVVQVRTLDGTALGGSDFTPVDRKVTIPAGATTALVTVDVTRDSAYEPTELFTLEASILSGTGTGSTAQATGKIIDDDLAAVFAPGVPGAACTGTLSLSIPGWTVQAGVRLSVDWGDGSAVQQVTPTAATLTLTHAYTLAGMRAVRVTIADGGGQLRTVTVQVPVAYRTAGLTGPLGTGTPVKYGTVVPAKIAFTNADGSVPANLAPVLTVRFGSKTELTARMRLVQGVWQATIATSLLPRGARTHAVTVTVPGNGQVVQASLKVR